MLSAEENYTAFREKAPRVVLVVNADETLDHRTINDHASGISHHELDLIRSTKS